MKGVFFLAAISVGMVLVGVTLLLLGYRTNPGIVTDVQLPTLGGVK